ncbi:hypothetical protein [Dictyobacter aurantiacus]|uniref:Uncharacterized protein n=1 Tax=Dictyobacter aurantiacus TaxID=1936993 RepID=A0A401ZMR1_9CHLR|nr:hypothetical protein [Dictyobacter aurantiacus]GCE08114.1 hypothetical protein KDAU_54430 [Dictyobacter aurantiacus]
MKPEKKLSEQFVDFVDLTDESLEEVELIQGGTSASNCGGGSWGYGYGGWFCNNVGFCNYGYGYGHLCV